MLKTHLEHITLIETVLLNSCLLKYNPLVIYSNTTNHIVGTLYLFQN